MNVFGESGLAFEVHNGTSKAQVFTVTSIKPRSGLAYWEMGYEEIPDPSWCRLDKEELEVPAHTDSKVYLFVKIPDKPEYYNRKWMALITCHPGRVNPLIPGALITVLSSRVMIETQAKRDVEYGVGAGSVRLIPSICQLIKSTPGSTENTSFKLCNNTPNDHTYKLMRLDQVEKEKEKHERYVGHNCTPVITPSWLTSPNNLFMVKSGKNQEVKLEVKVPKKADVGKCYEELLFLKDEKDAFQFVRVRVDISETGKDKP